jgi:dGTP triphosphohydrolase
MNAEAGRETIMTDPVARQRAVGDFIAGMTDMFALKTHATLLANGALEPRAGQLSD